MPASWSELTHCPVKYTFTELEQSRVMMVVLGARPVNVTRISEEETALIMITVFMLNKNIDWWMLTDVINTRVSKLLSVDRKEICDVKLRRHFFVCHRRDKASIEIMQTALCL